MGKFIGGLIGLFTFGFLGAIIGLLVGHLFDKGRKISRQRFDPLQKAAMEHAFIRALFPLMGHIAKSDGRVSEVEIQATESLILKLGLDGLKREEAVALFRLGVKPEFDLDQSIDTFLVDVGPFHEIKKILLVYLISLAYADGSLHQEEEKLLTVIARKLGYSTFAFNHLMGMIKAQAHFYSKQGHGQQGGGFNTTSESELELAYQALGVAKSATDTEVKKAYRKLMSEYHPDKLQGQGLPDDVVNMATEKSKEIQVAYDLVKKSRK